MLTRLIRNSGWNLAGQAIPVLMALVSIPILIRTIGDSRFGFLSIAWMLIGYFGVLDMGIGRALTHGASKQLAHDPSADIADLAWTGIGVLLALGVVAGGAIAALSPWLVGSFIDIAPNLKPEALRAFLILSAAVPFVLVSAGLSGILQARQEFRTLGMVQMPLGVLLFAGPLVVIKFSVQLNDLVLPLVILRLANCIVLLAICARKIGGFARPRFSRSTVRELLSFGGWMTVTNLVSPIMVNMDRLFIGSRLGVAAVTYYVTPFEVVSKLLMIPSSIAAVSFPDFSRFARLEDRYAARHYLLRSLALVLVVLVPPALVVMVLAHSLLGWWVSPELADRSALVMRLLALGVIINGACYVPFAYVQGMGRSDLTAKFHLFELSIYIPLLLGMIGWLGLTGVALAWLLRVSLDAALLFSYTWTKLLRNPAPEATSDAGRLPVRMLTTSDTLSSQARPE